MKNFSIIIPIYNESESIFKLIEEIDIEFKNKSPEIIIVNEFGVITDYLSYAKSVFIGKSLLKKFKNDGGQNPILAANSKERESESTG